MPPLYLLNPKGLSFFFGANARPVCGLQPRLNDMQKRLSGAVLACVIAALSLTHSSVTQAATALVWQTSFDCPEWTQSRGLSENVVCGVGDGIAGWGAWTTPQHPNGDEITLAANYPGGGGGRGFRHWRGDGSNVNSGGLLITLPATLPEMWIRFYMRYESGFNWSPLNYTKDLYVNVTATGAFTVGFHSGDGFGVATISPSRNIIGSPGWASVNGGTRADGLWHCYETHVKVNTSGANGIAEAWIDGRQSMSFHDVDFKMIPGWSFFGLGSNQATPANGGEKYTDYDDIAVSASGRIGCAGGGLVAPAPPMNVRIIR